MRCSILQKQVRGIFDAETRLRFPCRDGSFFRWEHDKPAAARTRPKRISIVGGFAMVFRTESDHLQPLRGALPYPTPVLLRLKYQREVNETIVAVRPGLAWTSMQGFQSAGEQRTTHGQCRSGMIRKIMAGLVYARSIWG